MVFQIKIGKKKFTFLSVIEMEKFIIKHKDMLMKSCIEMFDEHNGLIGILKIDYYVKKSFEQT
jgi:hypothetical protein